MSDEIASNAPATNTSTTEQQTQSQAAPAVAPSAPPPLSDAAPAGADKPSADTPPGAAPGAATQATPPAEEIIESKPIPEGTITKTTDVIDTQDKAAELLGSEGGVHPPAAEPPTAPAVESELKKIETAVIDEFEHPLDTIARIRATLHGYGQEVHDAVARDIERLQKLFS